MTGDMTTKSPLEILEDPRVSVRDGDKDPTMIGAAEAPLSIEEASHIGDP